MKARLYINSITFSSILFLFLVSSCFKNEPKREMMRAAGTWTIKHVERTEYDENGSEIATSESDDLGVLMFNHFDDFLFEGSFSASYNQAFYDWNSDLTKLLIDSDTWFISVDAKNFEFSSLDSESGFVSFLGSVTVNKLNNRKLEWLLVTTHANGNVRFVEKWYLKRGYKN